MAAQPFRLRHYPRPEDTSPDAPGTGATPPYKKISLERKGHGIRIANKHATDTMEISFDGGRTYYPIKAGTEFSEDGALFLYFFVRSTTGNAVAWSALVREG